MAVASFTALVYNGLVPPLDMALLAFSLYMFPFQLVSPVFGRVMPEKGRLPTLDVMAGVAFPVLELLLVGIAVTCGRIACRKRYPLELVVLVTLGAKNLHMSVSQRIFGLVVVDLNLLPALRGMAILTQRLSLMGVFVTCDTLFILFYLKPVVLMALHALNINVLSSQRVF